MAIGLLGSGMMQGNAGGGFSNALQYMGGAGERRTHAQLQQMQIQNMQSEIAARNLSLEKDRRQQELIKSLFPSGQSSPSQPAMPGQFGSGSYGAIAPPQGQPAIPPAQPNAGGMMNRMSMDQLTQLKLAGVDLTDLYKLANVPTNIPAGGYAFRPGQPAEYMPDPVKGVTMNNGQVSLMPGAAQTQAALTYATEAPKAYLQSAGRVNVRTLPDGSQVPVSEISENPTLQSIIPGYGGQGPAAAAPTQQAPQQQAPMQAPAPLQRQITPQAQRGADQEAIRVMESELRNPNLPPDQRAGVEREIARMRQAQAMPGFPAASSIQSPRMGPYGKTTEQATREKLVESAGGEINTSWVKSSYEPTVAAGNSARDVQDTVKVTRQAMENLGKTGWSVQSQAAGAAVLSGLGIAPQNAKMFAANAELFQAKAMERVNAELSAAKGPQTDQDAIRAQQTFASLRNTPQANKFILDMTEAKAMRDQMKARFYQEALPIARQKGDLSEVDREWSRRAPSIFTMPPMQSWAGGIK
jgi:hypothetical protein